MKKILDSTALSVLLILTTKPANAATTGNNYNPLSGIIDWLNQGKDSVEKYAKTLTDKVITFGYIFSQIAQDTAGDLDLIEFILAKTRTY
jgi:hypothetical protein